MIIHALFECTAARTIWEHSVLKTELIDAPTSSLDARWIWLKRKMRPDDLRTMAALMWAAWTCRNKIFFEHEKPDAVTIATGYVRMVEEYRSYTKKVFMPSNSTNMVVQSPSSWSCPMPG